MVPGFDEIIFRNRNQSYGAFRLRKQYKATASISVLFGASVMVLAVLLLAMKTGRGIAIDIPVTGVIIDISPIIPDIVEPVQKRPVEEQIAKMISSAAPVVSSDTGKYEFMMPEDNDPVVLVENYPVDSVPPDDSSEQIIPVEPVIRLFVEEPPEFPGGEPALLKYVADNIMYPGMAIENNIQGKVYIKFAVWDDGSVRKVQIIKGIDPLLDAEALRVISTLPLFRPGRQNGVAVPVWFAIPVAFELRNP